MITFAIGAVIGFLAGLLVAAVWAWQAMWEGE